MDCYVISYDIPNDKRRTKVASLLEDYGHRVQYSVFECWLDKAMRATVEKRLNALIKAEEDSVRLYLLCAVCREKTIMLGQSKPPQPPGVIIL